MTLRRSKYGGGVAKRKQHQYQHISGGIFVSMASAASNNNARRRVNSSVSAALSAAK